MFNPVEIMPGTEGTKEYVVLLNTKRGRLGVRNFNRDNFTRVRVEPNSDVSISEFSFPGWKQPDRAQRRFSTVVSNLRDLQRAISYATSQLT